MIVICSNSTKKYFNSYNNLRVISGKISKEILSEKDKYENVIACGGGTVIDAAKILSKNPIICYPTTASGASKTSHSVIWDNENKLSIKRQIPKDVIVKPEFLENIPENVIYETRVDLVSHCFDVLHSKKRNSDSERLALKALEILENKEISNEELVIAGNLAGEAIQITSTTILHSLSYPLTGNYNISHGKALSYFLPILSRYIGFPYEKYFVDNTRFDTLPENIDLRSCIQSSLKYNKIENFRFKKEKDITNIEKIIINNT